MHEVDLEGEIAAYDTLALAVQVNHLRYAAHPLQGLRQRPRTQQHEVALSTLGIPNTRDEEGVQLAVRLTWVHVRHLCAHEVHLTLHLIAVEVVQLVGLVQIHGSQLPRGVV